MSLTQSLIYSLLVAFAMAFIGYLKKQPDEEFQPEKIMVTVIAAVAIALLVTAFTLPFEEAENLMQLLLIKTGLIHYTQDALKALIIRVNLGKRINDWLDKWLPAYR